MATNTALDTSHDDAHHVDAHHGDDHGPSDRFFVMVAVALAIMTLVEVLATEVGIPAPWTTVFLLVLMVIKFLTVTSLFMHLKWDNKLFSLLFYTGLVLSVGVYVVALACFQFFAG